MQPCECSLKFIHCHFTVFILVEYFESADQRDLLVINPCRNLTENFVFKPKGWTFDEFYYFILFDIVGGFGATNLNIREVSYSVVFIVLKSVNLVLHVAIVVA